MEVLIQFSHNTKLVYFHVGFAMIFGTWNTQKVCFSFIDDSKVFHREKYFENSKNLSNSSVTRCSQIVKPNFQANFIGKVIPDSLKVPMHYYHT